MNKTNRLFIDTRSGPYPGAVRLNCVGSPELEFGYYAEAFHEAGQTLVRGLRGVWKSGGNFSPVGSMKAVPIVYLYWHAMELYLKSIILEGGDILPLHRKARIELKATHTLKDLADDVGRIFEEFRWDWSFGSPHFKTGAEFLSILAELQSVAEIRYPTRKKDGGAVLPPNFRFNLFQFCELLDSVFEALSLRAFAVTAELQQKQEMRAEWRQYEMENSDPSI